MWLSDLARRVESDLNVCPRYFNAIICRLYKDGSDKIDWHTDLRRNLDEPNMVIGSVSLGPALRTFSMRPVTNVWSMEPVGSPNAKRVGDVSTHENVVLGRGDLFGMMDRRCQSDYEHAVLPSKTPTGWRINLNFRHIRPEWIEEGLARFYRYCVYGDFHPLSDSHLNAPYRAYSVETRPDIFPFDLTLGRDIIAALPTYPNQTRPRVRTLLDFGFVTKPSIVSAACPSSNDVQEQVN